MIGLEASSALILYLSFTLAVLFFFWGRDHLIKKNRPPLKSSEELFVCEYCHYLYLAPSEKQVTGCPQCGSLNKKNRFSK